MRKARAEGTGGRPSCSSSSGARAPTHPPPPGLPLPPLQYGGRPSSGAACDVLAVYEPPGQPDVVLFRRSQLKRVKDNTLRLVAAMRQSASSSQAATEAFRREADIMQEIHDDMANALMER